MTHSDLDALIERLLKFCKVADSCPECALDRAEAAAALVQLRDSEALARGKIAEQLIKIEWLERMKQNYYDEAVKGWSKCRAAEAELDTQNRALAQCRALLKQEIDDVVPLRDKVAALEAERDALREPTETMIVAGVKTLLTGHDSQRHYVAALWRRMFDAAIDAARSKP